MDRDERKRTQAKTIKIGEQKIHIQAPPLKLTTKEKEILQATLKDQFSRYINNNQQRRAKDTFNLVVKLCLDQDFTREMRNKYFAKFKN